MAEESGSIEEREVTGLEDTDEGGGESVSAEEEEPGDTIGVGELGPESELEGGSGPAARESGLGESDLGESDLGESGLPAEESTTVEPGLDGEYHQVGEPVEESHLSAGDSKDSSKVEEPDLTGEAMAVEPGKLADTEDSAEVEEPVEEEYHLSTGESILVETEISTELHHSSEERDVSFENEEDDFGDFDDFEELDQVEIVEDLEEELDISPQANLPDQQLPSESSILCLSDQDFTNSAKLQSSVALLIEQITGSKASHEVSPVESPILESPGSDSESKNSILHSDAYFTARSRSLWHQLALEIPNLQPLDWTSSSTRRLFLISLGMPLDLDEILPKKNTKRLLLPPSARKTRRSRDVAREEDPTQAQDTDSKGNANGNENGSSRTTLSSASKSSDKPTVEAFREKTEIDLLKWYQLANVSQQAREGFSSEELTAHKDSLKIALKEAGEILEYWQSHRDEAVKDKEAFEGVIESLVEYAQRLRK